MWVLFVIRDSSAAPDWQYNFTSWKWIGPSSFIMNAPPAPHSVAAIVSFLNRWKAGGVEGTGLCSSACKTLVLLSGGKPFRSVSASRRSTHIWGKIRTPYFKDDKLVLFSLKKIKTVLYSFSTVIHLAVSSNPDGKKCLLPKVGFQNF